MRAWEVAIAIFAIDVCTLSRAVSCRVGMRPLGQAAAGGTSANDMKCQVRASLLLAAPTLYRSFEQGGARHVSHDA
jgi:hypothetical protein